MHTKVTLTWSKNCPRRGQRKKASNLSWRKKKESEEVSKNPATGQDETFGKPDRNKVAGMKDGNYEKLIYHGANVYLIKLDNLKINIFGGSLINHTSVINNGKRFLYFTEFNT